MIVDRNARKFQLREMRRLYLTQRGIHVSQGDAQTFRPRAEIIQQPYQYQLGIRLRSHPEFDGFETFASLDELQIGYAEFPATLRWDPIEPMGALLRTRPRFQKCCQLRIGTRRPPNHPKLDGDSQIGVSGRHNAARARGICRQDQPRHGTPRTDCPREGLTSVGVQRHRLSLVRCVPPHQRSIGLCRLKSSLCATIALPNSVSDSRLRR
jgi:hypothetical protein